MAIGVFSSLFYGTSIASGLGIGFLLLSKNENNKNIVLHILGIFTILLAGINFVSLASNDTIGKIISLSIIWLSISSIIINNTLKKYKLAYFIITLAIVITILSLFSFI